MILLHLVVLWLARFQVKAGLPDFKIFYAAGLIIRRGQAHSLYNDDLQLKTQREFVSPKLAVDFPLPYNHPPFEAVLYLPFTYVSFLQGYSLWFVVNLGLLGAIIYVSRPWLPALVSEFPILLVLLPLSFFPVFYALMQGQDSILLSLLYCLAYDAFRRERDLQAGIYLGLGLFKFHLVLPFAFILLLTRRWRAIAGMILSACCELAVSLSVVGWDGVLAYPRYAWQVNRRHLKFVIAPENMPNLRGLLTGWSVLAAARPWLEVILLVLSIALLIWAATRWRRADTVSSVAWTDGFSLAVVVTFLVGYHGYNQDLSIILLPLLLIIDRALQTTGREIPSGLKICLGLFFLSPLYLVLTLHYLHQNLFALVVFCLATYLASPAAVAMTEKSTNRTTAQTDARFV